MLKASLKKFAKGGFRVVTVTGREGAADLYTDEVHRLYENVRSRSKVQFERLPAEYFRELARRLPDNTSFIYVYRGDQPVAFAASMFGDKSYHGLMLGIDYEINREYDLYFNMLFKSLDVGFRLGAHDIELGQTADSTKHGKLDIYQAPLSLYVKGGRSTARAALEARLSPPLSRRARSIINAKKKTPTSELTGTPSTVAPLDCVSPFLGCHWRQLWAASADAV